MLIKRAIPILLTVIISHSATAKGAVDWMEVVYDDNQHNAFTDLIQWKEWYYLCFRHASSHNSLDGQVWIVRSPDLKIWERCGVLDTAGDDRDPHFAATGGRLYVYFGVWSIEHSANTAPPDRRSVRSHFAMTTDGREWSQVFGAYEPGWWLWRVRYLNGAFYSAAYTAMRPAPAVRETRLLKSADGLIWERVSTVTDQFGSGEADFWFEDDGSMSLLTRTDGNAILFRSDPSLQRWEGQQLDALIHSPVMAQWKNRRFIAGRDKEEDKMVTKVWELIGGEIEERMILPSGGDTAYPGLVVDPASIAGEIPSFFITWYSQFGPRQKEETPNGAAIYSGRISIKP